MSVTIQRLDDETVVPRLLREAGVFFVRLIADDGQYVVAKNLDLAHRYVNRAVELGLVSEEDAGALLVGPDEFGLAADTADMVERVLALATEDGDTSVLRFGIDHPSHPLSAEVYEAAGMPCSGAFFWGQTIIDKGSIFSLEGALDVVSRMVDLEMITVTQAANLLKQARAAGLPTLESEVAMPDLLGSIRCGLEVAMRHAGMHIARGEIGGIPTIFASNQPDLAAAMADALASGMPDDEDIGDPPASGEGNNNHNTGDGDKEASTATPTQVLA